MEWDPLRRFSLLLLLVIVTALADASLNDDLVFDQDGKQFNEVPLIETRQHVSLFHRLKRDLFNWFSPGTTTTVAPTEPPEDQNQDNGEDELEYLPPDDPDDPNDPDDPDDGTEHQKYDHKKPLNLERLVHDKEDEYDNEEENEIGTAAEGRRKPVDYGNNDDEDQAGSGEVEGSASEGERTIFDNHARGDIKYYRVSLTVAEPYRREYVDRNSQEYKELSHNLTIPIVDLLNYKIPGETHQANVIKITPTSDSFTSQVTLDIGSTFTDEQEVENILVNQLHYHSLANIQVRPEGFTFRVFQVGKSMDEAECVESTELTCRDGACVPLEARCDGIAQCEDGSDELDCPTHVGSETVTEESKTEEPLESSTILTGYEDEDEDEDEDVDVDENTLRPHSDKCRADDTVRCQDGSRYICSVQKCDGVLDCDDGEDEVGCPHPGCSAGEFACDVSRCILESHRCNFIKECDDGSDEHDCNYPACTSTQFKCRNSQCIDSSLHCNGEQDCHDGSDELNCSCRDDKFECTPGFCVDLKRLCDGVTDCNNGKDEENCQNTTRCRPSEFTCLDGTCVSLHAKCDGWWQCPDKSDEFNCSVTTCSGDQFRCLDGSCISIDKRCNHHNDCRNGEDEQQCGCGEAMFRCTDGQCIGYELQCNGVEECSDGSDERDCGLLESLKTGRSERRRCRGWKDYCTKLKDYKGY